MSTSLAFGLPDVALEPGDHVCGFYFGRAERDEVLIPYLRAGLVAGERCICLVDALEPSVVVELIDRDPELDGPALAASGRLDVNRAEDSYLRDGCFSADRMIEYWEETATEHPELGPTTGTRVCGEMSWSLGGVPGAEELIGYESEINRCATTNAFIVLCLYDLEQFGGGIVVDLMRTHPKLMLGGMVIENPHFQGPDEYLATMT